jgi:hypothetical protein
MSYRFSQHDKEVLKEIGIAEEDAQMQLTLLQNGSNYTKLDRPAKTNDGILAITEKEVDNYAALFENEKANVSIARFIPASGMATRMFRFLHFFLKRYNAEIETLRSYLNKKKVHKLAIFLGGIEKFPFYKQVRNAISEIENGVFDTDYRYRFISHIVETLGKLPKALVPFHNYGNTVRTAAEEQLFFSKEFMVNNGTMNIHFTIPPSTTAIFKETLSKAVKELEDFNVYTSLSFSHQKRSTDTLSVLKDGNPLRDIKGKLIFRAAGHGSLIENLNAIEQDIVFMSNIDNISVNKYHAQTARYKKMLAGVLISLQNQVFQYCRALDHEESRDLIEIKTFIQEKLHVTVPDALHGNELIVFLKQKLNRPLRVCSMVKNEGEPGGGPFWVRKGDNISLQIVESAQVDTKDSQQKALFKKGTHFNPVDIVCGVYDHKGNKYDLTKFVDYETYFIAEKSVDGTPIKVLERPGLWNGAMADWNTVFVEVPVRTFNPVKTVNDLLRPMHQST